MNILHIDSSILGGASASRALSADIVARLRAAHPDAVIAYRDLAAAPLAHLSGAHLGAAQLSAAGRPAELAADLDAGAAALREFLAADTVVIGVAVYNFSVASQLKAWIDRILVAGQTFRYGPDGRPEGLASGKRVILAVARGGFYGAGTPMAAFEHAETYLRAAFAFIGIPSPEVIVAEGLAAGPEPREAALASAGQQIIALAA